MRGAGRGYLSGVTRLGFDLPLQVGLEVQDFFDGKDPFSWNTGSRGDEARRNKPHILHEEYRVEHELERVEREYWCLGEPVTASRKILKKRTDE